MNQAQKLKPPTDETADAVRSGIAQEKMGHFSAGIMSVQVFGLSILVGLLNFSWWWFLGTLVFLIMASTSKKFGKAVAVMFGIGWGAAGVAIGSFFGSDGMAAVLAFIGFSVGCVANLKGAQWIKDAK